MGSRLMFAVLAGLLIFLTGAAAAAPPAAATGKVAHDGPKYHPDEPLAQTFSLAKSADYLDAIAAFWLKNDEEAPKGSHPRRLRSCGACHANFAYMMARPLLLKERPVSLLAQTR